MTNESPLNEAWLKDVWTLVCNLDEDIISGLPIFPVLKSGDWDSHFSVQLVDIATTTVILNADGHMNRLGEEACASLEIVGVHIISSLPAWIPIEKVRRSIFSPSPNDISTVVDRAAIDPGYKQKIQAFNSNTTSSQRIAFISVVSKCPNLSENALMLLSQLQAFCGIDKKGGSEKHVSVHSCQKFIINKTESLLPAGVKFQETFIRIDPILKEFVILLGGNETSVNEIMLKLLKRVTASSYTTETASLMSHFIHNFEIFERSKQLIEQAKSVKFIQQGKRRVMTRDVFDPSDKVLKLLFFGENVFPTTGENMTGKEVSTLCRIGMKTIDDVTPDDLLLVAKNLDAWSNDKLRLNEIKRKSEQLLAFLINHPEFLKKNCKNSRTLAEEMGPFACIVPCETKQLMYPSCLAWHKHQQILCKPSELKDVSFCHTIGSVAPLVQVASDPVNDTFKWKSPPQIQTIIEQLIYIRGFDNNPDNRVEIVPVLKTIYQALADRMHECMQHKGMFVTNELIWTGTRFTSPERVITRREIGEIHLEPYVFFLPEEYQKLQKFFHSLGCFKRQKLSLLLSVLKKIESKYIGGNSISEDVETDRQLACSIIDRLAEIEQLEPGSIPKEQVRMLIHVDDNEKIEFANTKECSYIDNSDWLVNLQDDEDNTKLIHGSINIESATALGVESYSKQCLNDAENIGIEECGQSEKLTSRINRLLEEGYTDGLAVPKELIQNADDAGATVVKFLYDERENKADRKRLFTKQLQDFQGPAFWVYNNSTFQDKDFENIMKLNGATKADDTQTIGKFGLGFCSVYNMTDIPSFVSASTFVIFDPHECFLSDSGEAKGLKLSLVNRKLVKVYSDQFKPFEGMFGFSALSAEFNRYDGTLFRLPLRTPQQAEHSAICNTVYNKSDAHELLNMLIKASGNLLLFSQSVQNIEIWVLQDSCQTPENAQLCFRMTKEHTVRLESPLQQCTNVLKEASRRLDSRQDYIHTQRIRMTSSMFKAVGMIGVSEKDGSISTIWMVSWAMSTNKQTCEKRGLIPLAAVASPFQVNGKMQQLGSVSLGYYKIGHLFCFMPLPIRSCLPFHVNGVFNVRSDRTGLASASEDDRNQDGDTWNSTLMATSIVKAFVQHILQTTEILSQEEDIYTLWPHNSLDLIMPFERHFYRYILQENQRVFRSSDQNVSFNQLVCLDTTKMKDDTVIKISAKFLKAIPFDSSKFFVLLPCKVLAMIKLHNSENVNVIDTAIISEDELFIHFLNTIDNDFWNENDDARLKMIRSALHLNSNNVDKVLQMKACIPTEPRGRLRLIQDLVNPESPYLSNLFRDQDERFPLKKIQSEENLNKLNEIGMNHSFIPESLLVDSCRNVEALAQECSTCTMVRIRTIIQYLQRNMSSSKLYGDGDKTMSELKTCPFLPVLERPSEWPLHWFADSEKCSVHVSDTECEKHVGHQEKIFRLEAPIKLFTQSCLNVGSVGYILNEDILCKDVYIAKSCFCELGVQDIKSIDINCVMKQLGHIGSAVGSLDQESFATIKTACTFLYSVLEHICSSQPEEALMNITLAHSEVIEKPIILKDNMLLEPRNVAISIFRECPPDFYRLPTLTTLQREKVFLMLGVRKSVNVQDMLNVLSSKVSRWGNTVCEEIENISCLLENIRVALDAEGRSYDDLTSEQKEQLFAPDSRGILCCTKDLAIQDPDLVSSLSVKCLHGNIAPATGKALGVKTKKNMIVSKITSFIPFGQHEDLVTRLNGLLEDYPCDDSIMKELFQNADDAGATEITFIKFFESVNVTQTFGGRTSYRPALCVYNNSYFREEDFEGIRNLGIGSKSSDPSKTGQYGIGFNAVYHLTDQPSFLSKGPGLGPKGHLCIFDPLLQDLHEHTTVENPGIRCPVDEIECIFPDILKGFPVMQAEQGTMFRLQLRERQSGISRSCWTIESISRMIDTFTERMADCLQFVKNIKTVKVMSCRAGRVTEEYSVESAMSDKDEKKRKQFFNKVTSVSKANRTERWRNIQCEAFSTDYNITIKETNKNIKEWYVINQFGTNVPLKTLQSFSGLDQAFKTGEIGMLPIGGVSVELKSAAMKEIIAKDKEKCKYQEQRKVDYEQEIKSNGIAYCFLPLPVTTGMPFNVNGHFAVDRGRRGLWNQGIRKTWNQFVFKHVLVELICRMLEHQQFYWIDSHVQSVPTSTLRVLCIMYHRYFPLYKNTSDLDWKTLVRSFYENIIDTKQPLFPVIYCDIKTSQKRKTTISWVPLAKNATDLVDSGVFNTVFSYTHADRWFKREDARTVINVLKDVGLKIVETPKTIISTIKDAGICEIVNTDPMVVVEFLKARIVKTDVLLLETPFAQKDILKSLLVYALHIEDVSKFEGLPLKLTNDSYLRLFDSAKSTFCTIQHKLLPGSPDLFVHSDIVLELCREKPLFEKGFLKEFTVHDLLSLIAHTYDPSVYCAGNNVLWKVSDAEICPNILYDIFEFIYFQSFDKRDTHRKDFVNHTLFQENLALFREWSFLPSTTKLNGIDYFELVPIKNSHYICTANTSNSELDEVLQRFNIPVLDEAVLKQKTETSLIPYAVRNITANSSRPDKMLRCLHHYKSRQAGCYLTTTDADVILEYFNKHLKDLEKLMQKRELQELVCDLPLFESVSGDVISIDFMSEVIMIPACIPTDGIGQWSSGLNTTILKNRSNLQKLYTFLNISLPTETEFYARILVPRISRLSDIHRIKHVEYIKNNIITNHYLDPKQSQQRKILTCLRNLEFIFVDNRYLPPSKVYCKNNEVFQVMILENCFIPTELDTEEWIPFLQMLGVNMVPTPEMIVEYATTIACTAAIEGLTDTVIQRSKTVTNHLFSMSNDSTGELSSVFASIKNVKFVVPASVDESRRLIYRPCPSGNSLVALNDATSSSWMDVCWSSMTLLDQCPSDIKVMKQLGIHNKPPTEMVIKHCQNVCEIFSKKYKDGERPSYIECHMEKIYKYLDDKIGKKDEGSTRRRELIKKGLAHSDFVLIPGKAMKKPTDVFTLSGDEIKPYLYRASKVFKRYFVLFETAGACETTTCNHYVKVLSQLRSEFPNKELPPMFLNVAVGAIRSLFLTMGQNNEYDFDTSCKLYLPNKESILTESTLLIVSDNGSYAHVLKKHRKLNFFLGFREMEIKINDPISPFRNLPEMWRPRILSDDVEWQVAIKEVCTTQSDYAVFLETFVKSDVFVGAIVRLLRHQIRNDTSLDYTEDDERQIIDNFLHIRVFQVKGLETYMKYMGERVSGTNKNKACHVETTETVNKLYFQASDSSNLIDIVNHLRADPDGLMCLVNQCTMDRLNKFSFFLVREMFSLLETPCMLDSLMDDRQIRPYDCFPNRRSVFPAPGTLVPEKFFPFIVNAIRHFETHEYQFAAYVSEIDEIDQDRLAYIYVNIIQEIPTTGSQLAIRYKINTGTGIIEAPLCRLYKFLPQVTLSGHDIEVSDAEPIELIPFDETCMKLIRDLKEAWTWSEIDRKILINRLLKRWHPDRNMEQQEYASRIFNFINEIILRLERGQNIDVDIDESTGRTSPDMTESSYEGLSSSVYRSGKVIAMGYKNNRRRYRKSRRGGDFAHNQPEPEPVPCLQRAKKWMKQAKQDYIAGQTFLLTTDDFKSYNWICYVFHQACEKALKAAWHARDSNRCPLGDHNLSRIVCNLEERALATEVRRFEDILGGGDLFTTLQYPTNLYDGRIPSDTFTKAQAEQSMAISKTILEMVDDIIEV